jgi:hypothetical protein
VCILWMQKLGRFFPLFEKKGSSGAFAGSRGSWHSTITRARTSRSRPQKQIHHQIGRGETCWHCHGKSHVCSVDTPRTRPERPTLRSAYRSTPPPTSAASSTQQRRRHAQYHSGGRMDHRPCMHRPAGGNRERRRVAHGPR